MFVIRPRAAENLRSERSNLASPTVRCLSLIDLDLLLQPGATPGWVCEKNGVTESVVTVVALCFARPSRGVVCV